jgi:hypothetical protein
MARPYTGRRVSSLVPWGGSEKPETVCSLTRCCNQKRERGVGKEKEQEMEQEREEREKEREKARERAREEKEREQAEERAREEKERGLRKKVKRRVRDGKEDEERGHGVWVAMAFGASQPTLALGRQTSNCHVGQD